MMNIKRMLREELAFKGQLDEIDWEDTFSDVRKACIEPKALVEYLNKVRSNKDKEYGEKEKFDAKYPFIHAKSSFFKDKPTGVDVDYFIKEITKKPKNVVNTNEKILKSGGPHEYVYKTGVPAFRGIVYDIDKDKFYFINTCPGAGDCVLICYALKGNFIRYAAAYDSMTRRLNYLLNYPEKYEQQLYDELKAIAIEHKALSGYKAKVLLRWNDSGDFFTKKYVDIAERVMKRLQDDGYNVTSYAYTKMADVAKDQEFGDATFSAGANKQQTSKIDLTKHKLSKIVPSEIFKGLDLMRMDDEQELKKRIATKYQYNLDDIITYDEMMTTPKSEVRRWHVIVTPNDGDDAAFRKDVKTILLTQH